MASEENIRPIGLPSSGDLSAAQYCFVYVDTNGFLQACGAGAAADGILQDKPRTAGEAGSVQPLNGAVSKLFVGSAGVATPGLDLASDETGKAVAAAGGDYILAKSLQAGAAGDLIPVLTVQRGIKPVEPI